MGLNYYDLKQRIDSLNRLNSDPWPIEWQLAWIMEEFGEVSGELLKLSNLGGRFNPEKDVFNRNALAEEIGDVLYGLASLADNLNIDLLEALDFSISKFELRKKNTIE